jgi:APA family basic amino acid/polyamine antiporter
MFPVVAVIGFFGIAAILAFTLYTHAIGRIAGPLWVITGLGIYLVYRSRKGLPLLGSRRHDYRTEQYRILREAGELDLMDEYASNVRAREAREQRAASS